jgi:predicted PurR-regulated permease PerM
VVTALFLIAALSALVIFIVGFSRHGIDFVKHGFMQKGISDLAEKIDSLDSRLSEKISNLDSQLSEKISNLDSQLSEKMSNLDSQLSEKMSNLDFQLSEKINNLDFQLSEKINNLDSRLSEKISGLRGEFKNDLELIRVNHFGHLKDFLTELTSILLDKGIINNQDKARLDYKLGGM